MTSFAHVPNPFEFAGDALTIMARFQCETMGLLTRRAQAYVDLPRALAQCHSPEDLLSEQVRFWQVAQRQYAESYERALAALPVGEPGEPAAAAASATPRRDYMVVTDLKAEPAKDQGAEPAKAVPASRPTIRVRRSA